MHKLVKKYQFGNIFDLLMKKMFSEDNINKMLDEIRTEGKIQKYNKTETLPGDTEDDPEVKKLKGLVKDKSDQKISNIKVPGKSFGLSPFDKMYGNNVQDKETTNYNNRYVYGLIGAQLGRGLGQQIGGKYEDEISQIGGILGHQILSEGNLKGLFTGGSGRALGAVGTSMLNKSMGGDKNKGFVSEALTNYAPMLWQAGPVAGAIGTGLTVINNIGSKSTQDYTGNDMFSQEAQSALGGSYQGSMQTLQKASNAEGRYGLFDRITGQYKSANRKVDRGNTVNDLMGSIYKRRELGDIRKNNDIGYIDYDLYRFGGYDQYGTVIGRKGMKLPTINDINRVRDLLKFKKGGQMNVIPEGALHARLHHMETGNKITKKGIPVIDKQGEQQAEIERNEIIFSLEVTNKLEELRKDGSDKAALEAGKLLVDEIFHNTDDRTGLIQEVIGQETTIFKEGGILAEKPDIESEFESELEAEEPIVGMEEVEYYQTGGIIAEEPDGSDDEDIEEYQKGKKVKKVKSDQAYYDKDTNTIYYTNKESKRHEMAHAHPNQELIEYLRPYWENLTDEKITELGGNLDFVKRFEGDPGHFFSPEEIAARIEAGYEQIKDQDYTNPDFFRDITSNEQYGDNIYDLVNMLSPEKLAKIYRGYYYDQPKRYNGPVPNSLTYDETANEYISDIWSDDTKAIKSLNKQIKDLGDFGKYYKMVVNPNGDKVKFVSHEKYRKGSPYYRGEYPMGGGGGPIPVGGKNGDEMYLSEVGEIARPVGNTEDGGTIYETETGEQHIYYKQGGIINQINKLSPEKLQQLESILKLLNND